MPWYGVNRKSKSIIIYEHRRRFCISNPKLSNVTERVVSGKSHNS